MGRGLARGFRFAFRGLSYLLSQTSLWGLAALPVLLNILLFGGGIWTLIHFFPDLLGQFMDRPEVWYWWIAYVLLALILVLAFALLIIFSFTALGCALAGPFLDLLSERVERQLGRTEESLKIGELAKEIGKGLVTSVAAVVLLLLGQLLLLLLWFVPVVGHLVYLVANPLLGAYFFAVEFFDFPLGRRRLTTAQRFRFINRHKGESVGFGLAVFLTTMIPLLNFLMMPAATVGATMLVRELEGEESDASIPGGDDSGTKTA